MMPAVILAGTIPTTREFSYTDKIWPRIHFAYTYKEWKSEGNSAPQEREEEITSSVCKEAK